MNYYNVSLLTTTEKASLVSRGNDAKHCSPNQKHPSKTSHSNKGLKITEKKQDRAASITWAAYSIQNPSLSSWKASLLCWKHFLVKWPPPRHCQKWHCSLGAPASLLCSPWAGFITHWGLPVWVCSAQPQLLKPPSSNQPCSYGLGEGARSETEKLWILIWPPGILPVAGSGRGYWVMGAAMWIWGWKWSEPSSTQKLAISELQAQSLSSFNGRGQLLIINCWWKTTAGNELFHSTW